MKQEEGRGLSRSIHAIIMSYSTDNLTVSWLRGRRPLPPQIVTIKSAMIGEWDKEPFPWSMDFDLYRYPCLTPSLGHQDYLVLITSYDDLNCNILCHTHCFLCRFKTLVTNHLKSIEFCSEFNLLMTFNTRLSKNKM